MRLQVVRKWSRPKIYNDVFPGRVHTYGGEQRVGRRRHATLDALERRPHQHPVLGEEDLSLQDVEAAADDVALLEA